MNREDMVQFVKDFFESHDPIATELIHRYPFRRRFGHCFRCSVWARRIALAEGADVETVETAALFHDIGKAVMSEGDHDHGKVGASICDEYLKSVGYDENRRAVVSEIVLTHSQHAAPEGASMEEKIVSDADFLDETGAIAILWDVMASALEPHPSYDKAYERCLRFSTRLRDRLQPHLHTDTARKIAQERFALIDAFVKALRDELGQ